MLKIFCIKSRTETGKYILHDSVHVIGILTCIVKFESTYFSYVIYQQLTPFSELTDVCDPEFALALPCDWDIVK